MDKFRELSHRQLIVIGEPGAGKSVLALLLALGLIEHPLKDEPVPVLLPISTWEPQRESVVDFATRRLTQDYPIIAGTVSGQEIARQLVEQARVLLVLDGLDELTTNSRAVVVRRLDEFAAGGRPLVATCRSQEYEQTIRSHGQVVSRAAVVEIEPVTMDQAIEFLSHPAPSRPRWSPVFDHLRQNPGGLLVQTLLTPLMVSLARTAYQPPSTDPTDLIRAGTHREIRATLLDAYVETVNDPDQPLVSRRLRRNYSPTAARRYLETLALHLHLSTTVELVWWQLRADLFTYRPHRASICAAALLTSAAGLTSALALGPWAALWTVALVGGGLSLGAKGWLAVLWPDNHPATDWDSADHFQGRFWRIRIWLLRAVVGGQCALLTWLLIGSSAAGANPFVIYVVMGFVPTRSLWQGARGPGPGATLGAHHIRTFALAAQYAIAGGLLFTTLAALGEKHGVWIAGATAAAVFGWIAACSSGLWTWLHYRAVHLQLVAQGRLPLFFIAFLRDQHQRGTVRRSGSTWQVRHVVLQEHLALAVIPQRLRIFADHGYGLAALFLAQRLEREGRIDEAIAILRLHAERGNQDVANELVDTLARHGRVKDLQARADAGEPRAIASLADALARQERAEEAIELLRPGADDDWDTASRLVDLLESEDRIDEAVTLLQSLADHHKPAARRLVNVLAESGRVEEAIELLRPGADDDWDTASRLVDLLESEDRIDEAVTLLQSLADHHERAAWRLRELLAEENRVEELGALADHGDQQAAWKLAQLLARDGRVDELHTRADQGDMQAGLQLADLLAGQGETEKAMALLQPWADSHWDAAHRLSKLLVGEGRIDDAITAFEPLAAKGAIAASWRIADLLAELGRVDEAVALLQSLLKQGGHRHIMNERFGWNTIVPLVDILEKVGRVDEAISLLHAQINHVDRRPPDSA